MDFRGSPETKLDNGRRWRHNVLEQPEGGAVNGLLCTEMFRMGFISADLKANGHLPASDAVRLVAEAMANARDDGAQELALRDLEDLAGRLARAGDARLEGVLNRLTCSPITA